MSLKQPIEGVSDCCTAPTSKMTNVRNKGHQILVCTKCKKKLWEYKPETITSIFAKVKERITTLI